MSTHREDIRELSANDSPAWFGDSLPEAYDHGQALDFSLYALRRLRVASPAREPRPAPSREPLG
ncbi:hypothetical protein, partial [Streptomyces sp. NPDC056983]|uniref:hypothetical protein n=1 Tax=Streptomyces sp. NPDC056983 TaxID=3345987 RepID=UPI00363EA219